MLVADEPSRSSVVIFLLRMPSLFGSFFALLMTPQWIGRGLLFFNNSFTVVMAVVVIAANVIDILRWGHDGALAVRLAICAALVRAIQFVFWWWCGRHSARARVAK